MTSRPVSPAIARTGAVRISRRTILEGPAGMAGLFAASGLGAPAQARRLTIGSQGGCFETAFNEHVFPKSTVATGIEPVTQPNSSDGLATMQNAAQSGSGPADPSLHARDR